MAYNIQWIDNDILIELYDDILYNDFNEINDLIYGDGRFDTMKYQCVDLLKVTKHNIDLEDMRIISALEGSAAVWKKYLKIAHIAVDPIALEFISFFKKQMENSNWEIELFANREDALKWCKS